MLELDVVDFVGLGFNCDHNWNVEIRMSKPESMTNTEARNSLRMRHCGLVIPSSFVIRHSSFVITGLLPDCWSEIRGIAMQIQCANPARPVGVCIFFNTLP